MQKQLINELFTIKAKNDDNSKSLANLLNVLTNTVFGSTNRFVFELLQNADDSPNLQQSANVEVEFVLTENYLVFSHDGKHFSEDDVRGISNVASGDSGKAKDREKTGYKGIGFKSVFGISSKVLIKSNDFIFRFDKNYDLWKEKNDYPWQIIPIWSEDEIPDEVKLLIDEKKVTTIILINNQEKILEEISEVFKDPQITLFLRNVNSISFFHNKKRVFKVEKKARKGFFDIYYNDEIRSSWLIKDYIIEVSKELKEKLNQLSDYECPEKLKSSTRTKITFAALVKDNELTIVKDSLIYSYLPTKLNLQFPFLINGDFILNAERTDLLENDWNYFLLYQIAYYKIKWISELANSNPYKYQIASLIKNKFPQTNSIVKKSYNEGLEHAINTIEFIPGQSNGRLLKVKECLIDQISFSNYLDPLFIEKFYQNNYYIADTSIKNTSKLVSIGAESFSFDKLIKLLEWPLFREFICNHENNLKFIFYLFSITFQNKNEDWHKKLTGMVFLLTQSNQLRTPGEVYYPFKSQNELDFIQMDFLHSDVFNNISTDKNIYDWLNAIGLKQPSEIEILRRSIYQLIDNKLITSKNAIEVGQFVFKVFKSGSLSDQDYKILRRLPLLSTNEVVTLPEKCYLADIFEPELRIESILLGGNFVSKKYIEPKDNILRWKEFFIKIGVRERVQIYQEKGNFNRRVLQDTYPQISNYLMQYIDNNSIYPPRTYAYRDSQHTIKNFVFIEFMEYLKDYSFSKLFWKIVFENYWTAIYTLGKDTTYHTMISNTKIDAYIQYRVANFPSIPSLDGKSYTSDQVYSPELKSLLEGYLPIVDIDYSLTNEQIDFLRIKKNIDIEDILKLLSVICREKVTSKKTRLVFLLYKHLIHQAELDSNIKDQIEKWRNSGKLLATNDEYRDVTQLFCFMVAGVPQPSNSKFFIRLPTTLTHEEQCKICSLFNIPIITYSNLELKIDSKMLDKGLEYQLKLKNNYICSLYSNITFEDESSIHQKFNNTLQITNFYKVEFMELVFQWDNTVIYNQRINTWFDNNNNFYFADAWNSPLTLYSLSNSLCNYFGLNRIENELTLLLQLDINQLRTWFLERGYSLSSYSDTLVIEKDITEVSTNIKTLEINDEECISDEVEDDFLIESVDEFSPEITTTEINYNNLDVKNRNYNFIMAREIRAEYESLQDDQVKFDIGKWGEEVVYNYLKSEYDKNNGNSIFVESNTGFTLIEDENVIKRVTWNNMKSESYLPYDFIIEEDGTTNYIEVKSTPSDNKSQVDFSQKEWQWMFEQKDHYFIYRVFNVGKINVRIEIIECPSGLIINGKISLNPIRLII